MFNPAAYRLFEKAGFMKLGCNQSLGMSLVYCLAKKKREIACGSPLNLIEAKRNRGTPYFIYC